MRDYDKIFDDPYSIKLLEPTSSRQSDEFIQGDFDGETITFNLHDYNFMYKHPLLYDIVLYDYLKCRTPDEIASVVKQVWEANKVSASTVRMLEIGAGSGAFGECMKSMVGVGELVGLDISAAAMEAARRDRPSIYDEYIVADLTALSPAVESQLRDFRFSCVGVASATGWGNHIPVAGFEKAFDLLIPGGWYIFHVKPNDPDPECVELCQWIETKIQSGQATQIYRGSHFHRLRTTGSEIFYDVVVAVKA